MLDGEKNIIEGAILGEASAFGLLYDHYQPRIYRFIYLKVSHREEAEDLTHQVFLGAWQNIGNYQFKGFPFSSWLYQIARNQVIDYYRTKKKNVSLENIVEPEVESSSEKTIDGDLDIKKVRQAITRLSQEQQDVIIMRFIEDLSPQETAKALNKSNGAVRLIQFRAIRNLRKILNPKS
ncbi:MAG: sigma-70 family RNA polymerase sigma factor [Patescibacteria group bacterium]